MWDNTPKALKYGWPMQAYSVQEMEKILNAFNISAGNCCIPNAGPKREAPEKHPKRRWKNGDVQDE